MIEHIVIIALIVQAIWYSMQEGEIIGSVGRWLAKVLPFRLHSPAFDCPVCMTPWYGLVVLFLLHFAHSSGPEFLLWPFILLGSMGLNVIIAKLYTFSDDSE